VTRRRWFPAVSIPLMVLTSCGFHGPGEPHHRGTWLRIEPDSLTIPEGREAVLRAVTDAEIPNETDYYCIDWEEGSRATLLVLSDPPGKKAIVKGWAAGVSTVNARHRLEDLRATARVRVTPVTARSLSILPADITVAVGKALQFHGIVRDSVGVEIQRPGWTWSASDPGILLIDSRNPDPWAKGLKPGRVTVTARLEALSATTVVEVE
jgi:hypothetical protein